MTLTRGVFQGYDYNRMVVLFTMMKDGAEVACAVSTGAMDDLERPFKATAEQREAQFLRLRGRIEARVAQVLPATNYQGKHAEIVVRTIDFFER